MARIALATALAACLLPAASAASSAGSATCARAARQIAHYEGMEERARQTGSQLWEERMRQHVELLRLRASRRCPELEGDEAAASRAFAEFLKLAGKAALSYFTLGAF